MLASFNAFHPIGRIGQVDDIADVIEFLLSDKAAGDGCRVEHGRRSDGWQELTRRNVANPVLNERGASEKDIHPRIVDALVRCACGNTFSTRSTQPPTWRSRPALSRHPAFTGVRRPATVEGRIQRFRRRYQRRVA